MSVDDWARREADKAWAWEEPAATAYVQGIVHAFSALLSDEAVEAGAQLLAGPFKPNDDERNWARQIVQAAIDAVTKEARSE